jgi:hypothetical protein
MNEPFRIVKRARETAAAYVHLLRAELGARAARARDAGPDRRFLLLAEGLPPDRLRGGSYRPTSFLQYAAANGWQAAAITRELTESPDRAAMELATHVPNDCPVIRVPPAPFQASRRVFPTIDGTVEAALQAFDAGRRQLGAFRPSVVVATGPPFHNFLAAFYLARHFSSKLVLDYRDEWTECPFSFVRSGRWDRAVEARILKHADGVVFTTRSQLGHALDAFSSLSRSRCFIVPNGWDPPPLGEKPIAAPRERERSRILLSFVGKLASHTDPGAFLDMLERLVRSRPELAERIRLQFVGLADDGADARLARFNRPEMIERVGFVPLREAQREMEMADILLLFAGADLARYVPGKLYEYLAAGRPIMVYGEPGEASDLVTSLSAGRRVQGENDFLRFLEDLDRVETSRRGSATEAWLAEHQRSVLAGRFFAVLEHVVGDRTS